MKHFKFTTAPFGGHMRYFDQKRNSIDPYGSCNVSSLAMALDALGIHITPDKLYQMAEGKGWVVTHVPTITNLAAEMGVVDKYTDKGTFTGIKKALDLGRPVILRGNFTGSGHIVAVKSYDKNGLIVNDPFGEWFWDGYDTNVSGESLHYSWNLIARLCSPESINNPSNIWFHQLYKK